MKLYPIYTSLVDVFSGEGWETWSRWKLIKRAWVQIAGPKVEHPALILKELRKEEQHG